MVIKIKVCGMTDPVNIRKIADSGTDYLGFIFYSGSERFVGRAPDPDLFRVVPAGIKKTGVFVNDEIQLILASASKYGLDCIQLHGNESDDKCMKIRSEGLVVIKTFHLHDDFDFSTLIKYMPVCDYFLFDTKSSGYGGSGQKFSWDVLRHYSLDKPFFLSGGIGLEDVEEIRYKRFDNLFAVDINSRFETSPGIKDFEKVKKFIDEIKSQTNEL